jgi:NAD(P)H-quinone oxidoreductase subunit 5
MPFGADHPWLVANFSSSTASQPFGLTRVFRLVFLGNPHAKTRRAPEVDWPMALPMVTLTVVTLMTPCFASATITAAALKVRIPSPTSLSYC